MIDVRTLDALIEGRIGFSLHITEEGLKEILDNDPNKQIHGEIWTGYKFRISLGERMSEEFTAVNTPNGTLYCVSIGAEVPTFPRYCSREEFERLSDISRRNLRVAVSKTKLIPMKERQEVVGYVSLSVA